MHYKERVPRRSNPDLNDRPRREADTCFGLAEKILDELQHGKFVRSSFAGAPESLKSITLTHIHLPVQERGVEKIIAACNLANAVLNGQLEQNGQPTVGSGIINLKGDACCWLERFDLKQIDYTKAKRSLQSLKKIFEERQNPLSAHPEFGNRAEGTYWLGPFNEQDNKVCGMTIKALLEFHGVDSLDAGGIWVQRGVDTVHYFNCNRMQLKSLLEKEGLFEKGRGV